MEKGTLKNFYENKDAFVYGKEKRTYLVIYENLEVNYGLEEDCNIEYCDKHNIPYYQIDRSAGCCVNAPGNINIADIRPSIYGFIEGQFS